MSARLQYAALIAIYMALGLGIRAAGDKLPPFMADHGGDALWAAMVYAGFRLLLTHRGITVSVLGSSLFAAVIECSQLYQAPWINAIRATTLGALVLGHGFLAVDLARYAAGIALAAAVDVLIRRAFQRQRGGGGMRRP